MADPSGGPDPGWLIIGCLVAMCVSGVWEWLLHFKHFLPQEEAPALGGDSDSDGNGDGFEFTSEAGSGAEAWGCKKIHKTMPSERVCPFNRLAQAHSNAEDMEAMDRNQIEQSKLLMYENELRLRTAGLVLSDCASCCKLRCFWSCSASLAKEKKPSATWTQFLLPASRLASKRSRPGSLPYPTCGFRGTDEEKDKYVLGRSLLMPTPEWSLAKCPLIQTRQASPMAVGEIV